MDGWDETGRDQPGASQASLDLDAPAVSDRFRLFNFTRRDDHLAYLWVLRALERLRAVHHVQAHPEDVAQALAVEDVLRARVRDANLSRLVFSDILEDLRALHAATGDSDGDQVYRRLSRLDTVLGDMSRRAAQFHLTLGEIMRSTDTSPQTFMKYKNVRQGGVLTACRYPARHPAGR